MTVNVGRPDPVVQHEQQHAPWTVDLIETGDETLTGGRVKRLKPYLGNGTFMLTWGDGVADVDLNKLLAFHRSHGKLATITAVRPQARYGHDGQGIYTRVRHGPVDLFLLDLALRRGVENTDSRDRMLS